MIFGRRASYVRPRYQYNQNQIISHIFHLLSPTQTSVIRINHHRQIHSGLSPEMIGSPPVKIT